MLKHGHADSAIPRSYWRSGRRKPLEVVLAHVAVAARPAAEVGYGTFAPPLTLITSPTTKLDSGEARKT